MSKPFGNDAWWDFSWNPVVGCLPASPGCTNCYAAQIAGTYSWPTGEKALHYGLTVSRGTRAYLQWQDQRYAIATLCVDGTTPLTA
jgi:protein gp37